MPLAAYLPQLQDSLVFFVLVSLEMAVLFVAVVFLGVYPAPVMDAIQFASEAILPPEGLAGLTGILD